MSNTCTCRQPQFFIPRSAFSFNEKAAFTDHVLKVLIESRFGSGYDYQVFEQPGDAAERVFCDLIDAGMQPFYALLSLGRKGHRLIATVYRRDQPATQNSNSLHHPNIPESTITPNLGRGSPCNVPCLFRVFRGESFGKTTDRTEKHGMKKNWEKLRFDL